MILLFCNNREKKMHESDERYGVRKIDDHCRFDGG